MAATKKWAQEEGIPVQEAECHLDSKLFLDEYPRWRADGPQCPCILQMMFAHAKEVGWKECKWTIHQGHQWQWPVPRAEAKAKTPAIQMVGFRTTREEVQGIYNEVYQWKRLPGSHCMGQNGWRPLIRKSALPWKSRHGGGRVPSGWKRIGGSHCEDFVAQPPDWILSLDLGKEWGPTWPGPQWSQGGTLKSIRATHLLEQDIESLSPAASRAKHDKCQHPYSCSHPRGGPQGGMPGLWTPIGWKSM